MDTLDKLGATAFEGHLVRKDLVRKYSRQYSVSTDVVECMLVRYGASVGQEEIDVGLRMVESQLADRTACIGDEEFLKDRIRKNGSAKLIDIGRARQQFTTAQWKQLLLRSIGFEPASLSERAQMVALLRMVPFVERNYNMVELGPKGTGKRHLYQQDSPYSCLISGGKTTVAKMFVNNASGQPGFVCQYDVVCCGEISGFSLDQKDGVNILKDYMESGEFSRSRKSIHAEGSIVMVGDREIDLQQQQKMGHILHPLPLEMIKDTVFMDRIHACLPGGDFPKLNPNEHFTDHFGLAGDFLSECWHQLRNTSRVPVFQGRVNFGSQLSSRDLSAVYKTLSGLIKLLYPDSDMPIPDEELENLVRSALECRQRVKEQQKKCLKTEFSNTHFSYTSGKAGIEKFVETAKEHSA